MRLSRIEMKGFKSFADETHLIFHDDVIGIVGPNGSGKSNIVDAIRWVLGEQSSRELRLESMGDVIFNGSKNKKASQAARVSLTFENTRNLLPTEYSEVTLTRKLYRTGESEYLINDVRCRLKDIHSLFMDSGVGSNSYAIIATGMVDDILADKENARHKMFEEAAGISKYKQRKKETLRKLQHTSEDLERIQDLLFEIEKNLKSLERQARRTMKYYQIKSEYKESSIALAGTQLYHLIGEKKKIEDRLKKEEETLRKLEGEIAKQEAEIERVKNENIDKEQALSKSQKEINALVGDIRNVEEELRIDMQQKTFRMKETEENESRVNKLEGERENLGESLDRYEGKVEKARAKYDELSGRLADIQSGREELKKDYEASRTAYDAKYEEVKILEKKTTELEKAIVVARSNKDSLRREAEKLEAGLADRRASMTQKGEEVDRLQHEERRWKKEIEEHENEISDLESQKEALENAEEELVAELQRLNRNLDAKTNERNLLREFVNKMEGFPESTKFLSRHKTWKEKGVILSDLLTAEPPYRALLENYLDQYLNFFIVDGVEDAVEAIQLLSDGDKGRAQFFVLNELEALPPLPAPDTEAVSATGVVQYAEKYRPLFEILLRGVYFTESVPEDGKVIPAEITLLQTDGHIQRRRGRISGGVVNIFEGSKLGRKQQIGQLEKEVQDINGAIRECEQKLDELNDQISDLDTSGLEKSLKKLKTGHAECLSKLTKTETTLDIYRKALETETIERDRVTEKLAAGDTDMADIERDWEKTKSGLEEIQAVLGEKDEAYRRLSEEYNELSRIYNESNILVIQQKNTVSALEREREILQEKLQSKEQEMIFLKEKISVAGEAVQKLSASVGRHEEALEKALQVRKEKEVLLDDAEKEYYKARAAVGKVESDLKVMNQQFRNSQALINEWKDSLNSTKFSMTRIYERLEIEFNVAERDIPEPEEEVSPEMKAELEVRCEKLKTRIQNYGEINPLAVEAYDEIKERHDTIVAQCEDVIAARDQLVKTIDEIETTATGKFMEAFNQVRESFREVFRRLFTEDDTCDLILLDPEQPLDSKIDIIARPKGKKPQSISQLSGGEKTLTAIALLFALYLLKPAPFCIFDEVDAPLDDSNIYKFNRIIREFSGASQFIIITHNKITMEAVDVIFGVFMEKTGVSNVAAVDFRHLDEVSELAAVS